MSTYFIDDDDIILSIYAIRRTKELGELIACQTIACQTIVCQHNKMPITKKKRRRFRRYKANIIKYYQNTFQQCLSFFQTIIKYIFKFLKLFSIFSNNIRIFFIYRISNIFAKQS